MPAETRLLVGPFLDTSKAFARAVDEDPAVVWCGVVRYWKAVGFSGVLLFSSNLGKISSSLTIESTSEPQIAKATLTHSKLHPRITHWWLGDLRSSPPGRDKISRVNRIALIWGPKPIQARQDAETSLEPLPWLGSALEPGPPRP